ncbi:MAG TPA: LPS export ABC transporter permease LptF [Stellaceae bacterium]|nr:LPS export ABC transporter permease LptF [Stellaceae bacterium]
MNRLTRYLFRQTLGLTLVVTCALTAACWLVQSLRLVEMVVDRGVALYPFLEMLALSLPQLLQLVVPIGGFVGVLFTYNRLIGDSEIVVMRACGVSQWQLMQPAILLAGLGTVVMMILSVYLLPASKNAFRDLQFQVRNQFSSGLLQEGRFNTLSDRLMVYVRERSPDGALGGLMIQDNRDPVKLTTYTAQRGLIEQVDGRPNVLMIDGTKEVWDRDKKTLSMLTFARFPLDLDQFRDVPEARALQPDERFLPDLFDPADVEGDPGFRTRLLGEGNDRLVRPIYCISYILVALAALLTGELNRRGQSMRILGAIGVMVVLQAASLWFLGLAARRFEATPLMYLAALLPIAAGTAMVLFGHQLKHRFGLGLPSGTPA